jgi:hypothetical protein
MIKYHCICFQETKLDGSNQLDTINFHISHRFGNNAYKLFVNDNQTQQLNGPPVRSGGVATYIHQDFPGFNTLEHLTNLDVPNRYQVIKTTWDNVPIYIHNVYAPANPPTARPGFFNSLPTAFPPHALHIVHGDFNIPMDSILDSIQNYVDHNEGKAEMATWLGHLGVLDAWRLNYPDQRLYSSPTRRNRLDYIFASEALVKYHYNDSSYREFERNVAGDHVTVSLTLQSQHEFHGKSYWRLPRELLTYESIRKYIKEEATTLLAKMNASTRPDRLWYGWKKRIKAKMQDLHKQLIRHDNFELDQIQRTFQAAQIAQQRGELDNDGLIEAENIFNIAKTQIKQYRQDKNFDFFASKLETSSAHFFRRPIQNLYKVPITSVEIGDGRTSTNTIDIQSRFRSHWGNIMGDNSLRTEQIAPPSPALQQQFARNVSRALTNDQRNYLDSELTCEDLSKSIQHMNPHKSPGPDGFSAAFFQVEPNLFAKILCTVFKNRLNRGILLPYQRNAAVILLYKKGPRGNPSNYRPIALIPLEVKIVSKALAYRLSSVLPDLIHPMQKGFVSGRSIHDHIHFVRDLQHRCTAANEHS